MDAVSASGPGAGPGPGPGRDCPPSSTFRAMSPFRFGARSTWASRGQNGGWRLDSHGLHLLPKAAARSDQVGFSRTWDLGHPASSWCRSSRYSCLFQHSRGSPMKTQLSTNHPQDAAWQQRVMDRLRKALRPLQWLLARVNTPLDGIDGAKAGAHQRRSVVIAVRSSDPLGASASHSLWSARQPRALALIPVRIATAQPDPKGQRRHRNE